MGKLYDELEVMVAERVMRDVREVLPDAVLEHAGFCRGDVVVGFDSGTVTICDRWDGEVIARMADGESGWGDTVQGAIGHAMRRTAEVLADADAGAE